MNSKTTFDFVIVGLGQTGLSCARFLAAKGYTIAVTDDRANPPGMASFQQEWPAVPCYLGEFSESVLSKANCIVMSPGVSVNTPAIAHCQQKGIPLWGDIELFMRFNPEAAVAAITGTNGKSTVTTLVGEMAKAAGIATEVGGNLGLAAMDMLAKPTAELYVLELSSFQLETTHSMRAKAATILNVTPDHLDRYEDFAHYVAAKQRIYEGAQNIVYNHDDTLTYPAGYSLESLNKAAISFSLDAPTEGQYGLRKHQGEIYLACGESLLLSTEQLKIKGKQNWANALAALAMGQALELPRTAMLDTLKNFPGLAHRCQWIRELNGVNWYNDSKGTNVGAAIAAIEGFGTTISGKVILIAGGQGKGADFSDLKNPVDQFVRQVILIGEDAPKISQALNNSKSIIFAKSIEEAVNMAATNAQVGDAVLLSPACASFDMFNNFAHRGDVFMELVKKLC